MITTLPRQLFIFFFLCIISIQGINAQNRIIVNPSFETGSLVPFTSVTFGNSQRSPNPTINGWYTNHPAAGGVDSPIEWWRGGANPDNNTPAQDGNYFVELNAYQAARLYQIVYLVNGEKIGWQYYHRQRSGSGTQTIQFSIYNEAGTSKLFTIDTNTASSTSSWDNRSGSYTFTGTTGIYQIGFEATTSGGSGNFLDNITIGLTGLSDFPAATATATEGAAFNPTVYVNGSVTSPSVITFTVTGGTAVEGIDYNFPDKTLDVPVGPYALANALPIGFSLIDNAISRGTRTVEITLSGVSGSLTAGDANGDGYKQTFTITINDNDPNPFGVTTVPNLWLKANAGVSPGATFEWASQGAEAIIASEGIAASQPTYNTSGPNRFNFNPSLSFDGTDDKLVTGNLPYIIGTSSGSDVGTQFVVYRKTNNSSAGAVYSYNDDVGTWKIGLNTDGYMAQLNISRRMPVVAGETVLLDMTATTSIGSSTLDYQKNGSSDGVVAGGGSGYKNVANNLPFKLGEYSGGYAAMGLSEIIVYPSVLIDSDRKKVQSYLAIKYGISLGNNTQAANYVNSTGISIYADGTFKYDVFGIGKDDGSGLNQTSSNSANTGSGDGTGQSGKGNVVLSNASSLGNNDFLLIGHDNAALTEQTGDLPTSLAGRKRLAREWKVAHTNSVGTVRLAFSVNGLTLTTGAASAQYRLMVDGDGDGNFTTGSPTLVSPASVTGDVITFDNVTLPNGAVFTFVTGLPFQPGGVAGSNIWFAPGNNVNNTGGAVDSWTNSGLLLANSTSAGNARPQYTTTGPGQINFNPSLVFDGSDDKLTSPNLPKIIGDDGTTQTASQFAVYRRNTTNGSGSVYSYSTANGPWKVGLSTSGTMVQQNVSGYLSDVNNNEVALIDLTASTSVSASTLSFSKNGSAAIPGNGSYSAVPDNLPLTLGSYVGYARMSLSELIIYPTVLTATERNKVQSYLALKYGISLGDNTDAVAYTSSAGTEIWPANTAFKYDIFGIGKDDASNLMQASSNSINSGNGDGTGQSAKGNIVLSNPSSLENGDFLLVGHNNAALTEQTNDLPTTFGQFKRLAREWKVKRTGDVGTVDMTFNLSGLTVTGLQRNDFVLLIDTDGDGNFTTGTLTQINPSNLFANVLTFSGAQLPEGSVFTFITGRVIDFDRDGVVDASDDDDDNDGILDIDEGFGGAIPPSPVSTVRYTTSKTAASGPAISTPSTGYVITSQNAPGKFAFSASAPGENGNGTGTGTLSKINIDADFAPNEIVNNVKVSLGTGSFDDGLFIEVDGVTIVSFNFSNYDNSTFDNKFGGGNSWEPWNNEGNPALELDLVNRTVALMIDVSDGSQPARQNALPFITGSTPNPVPVVDWEAGVTIGTAFQNQNGPGSIGTQTLTFSADVRTHVNSGPGSYDFQNLDSDGDGCFDVTEAGFSDPDNDGILGSGVPAVNPANGRVTSGVGYTTPKDGDNNSKKDFQEAGTANTITTQPASTLTTSVSDNASITVVGAGNNLSYQWQVSTDAGSTFSNITNGGLYSGATTATLQISNIAYSLNNYQYRVLVGNTAFACNPVTSSITTITVRPSPGGAGSSAMWLKADAGITKSGTNLTGWLDQAGINTFTVAGAPQVQTNAVNFKSTVGFANTGANTSLPTAYLSGNTPINYVDGFVVYKKSATANGAIVGSTVQGSAYGIGLFAGDNASDVVYVGNGADLQYQSFNNATINTGYNIVNLDLSITNTPFTAGRLNGINQTVTASGSDFSQISFIPMIGGTNNNGAAQGWNHFNGLLAEVVLYSAGLTEEKKNRVESYFALKYGITLGTTASVVNYTASDGTIFWTGNANYQHDVFGIGKDDGSDLIISQSNSVNSGNGDGTGQSGKANMVILNPSSLSNGDFLMIGHDNGALTEQTTDVPSGLGLKRIGREWKVKRTNDVGTVDLTLDLNGLAYSGLSINELNLLVDSDQDGDFTTGAPFTIAPSSYAGNVLTFTGVTLADEVVFTLSTGFSTNPGGIVGYNLWYKADNSTTNGGVVTLRNQGNLLSKANATAPTASNSPIVNTTGVSQINFNASLSFDGQDDLLKTTVLPAVQGTAGAQRLSTQFIVYRKNSVTGTLYNYSDGAGGPYAVGAIGSDIVTQNNFQRQGPVVNPGEVTMLAGVGSISASVQTLTGYRNGSSTGFAAISGSFAEINNHPFYIGGEGESNAHSNADIAEIIHFPAELSAAELNKVQSYLSIKYGISLGNNVDAVNYTASNDAIVWPASATYKYDIFGIGKDDKSGLNQPSSNSVNSGNGDGTGKISKGNIVLSNPSSLNDADFLMIGHNNGSLVLQQAGLANPAIVRVGRNWKVKRTNDVGSVSLKFDANGISNATFPTDLSKYFILIDTDGDANYTTGTVTQINPNTLTAGVLQFSSLTLPDNAVFTFAFETTENWVVSHNTTSSSYKNPGDVINYNISIINMGNVNISSVQLAYSITGVNATLTGGDTNTNSIMEPGETWVYSANYPVVQNDIDNGKVDNTLTVTGTPAVGVLNPLTDFERVQAILSPALTLSKNATTASFDQEGDLLSFDIEAENIGNMSLTNVVVDDPKATTVMYQSGDTGSDQVMSPGEKWLYQASASVTKQDLDVGIYKNTATVTGEPLNLKPASATASEKVDATQLPGWSLTNTSTTANYDNAGDVITYQLVLTNTGNVSIRNVSLTMPGVSTTPVLVSGDTDSDTQLDAGEVWNYSATYTVVQQDVNIGNVNRTATATGTPAGGVLANATDGEVVNAIQTITWTLLKKTKFSNYEKAGDILAYEMALTNTGNVTISGVTLTDPKLTTGPTLGAGDLGNDNLLQPGESWTYNATYAVTQADLDGGSVSSFATANGSVVSGTLLAVTDDVKVDAIQSPAFSLVKTSQTANYDAPGDVIDYRIALTNTGNITITGVSVTDDKTSAPVLTTGDANADNILSPGEIWIYQSSYTTTQTDVDNGVVSSTAAANGTPAAGILTAVVDSEQTSAIQTPAMTVDKTTAETSFNAAGDVLDYTIVLSNTGNISISNVLVTDSEPSSNPVKTTGDIDSDNVLDVGETWTYTSTYVVKQVDLDNGVATSVVNATGTPAGGTLAGATDSETVTGVRSPSWTITKTTTTATYTKVGDVVMYETVLKNTGNVSITSVTLSESNVTVGPTLMSGDTDSDQVLDVGEIWTYTAQYSITVNDFVFGSIGSTSLAKAISFGGTLPTLQANVAVNATTITDWSITKKSNTANFDNVGDVITYIIELKNTGNVPIDNINVVDTKVTTGPSRTSGDTDSDNILDIDETWIYSAAYAVTQVDINAGSVTGVASATGKPEAGTLPAISSTLTVNAIQTRTWTLEMTSETENYDSPDDVLTFKLVLTNTGNIPIANVLVSDPKASTGPTRTSGDTGSDNILGVGESWTYTATSIVSREDIKEGSFVNTATATGIPASGTISSVSATATVLAYWNTGITTTELNPSEGFSPNGDGINDFWWIKNIEGFPDNSVYVYNSSGGLVYKIDNYNNSENRFEGNANQNTVGSSNLSNGTYYYVIAIAGEEKLTGFITMLK